MPLVPPVTRQIFPVMPRPEYIPDSVSDQYGLKTGESVAVASSHFFGCEDVALLWLDRDATDARANAGEQLVWNGLGKARQLIGAGGGEGVVVDDGDFIADVRVNRARQVDRRQ